MCILVEFTSLGLTEHNGQYWFIWGFFSEEFNGRKQTVCSLQYGGKDSQCPHVSGVWYRRKRQNLGRAVFDRWEENANSSVWIDALSDTEVSDLDVMRLGRRQQHVLWLSPSHMSHAYA